MAVAVLVILLLLATPAGAQEAEPLEACEPYQGLTCDGYVTDAAGVLGDDTALEATVAQLIGEHGHELAVVLVDDTSGADSPAEFAEQLGETWGVGAADRDDGLVLLVDLGTRRTEVVWGPGLNDVLGDGAAIASAGDTFFGNGDFAGGIGAILGRLDAIFSGEPLAGSAAAAGSDDGIPAWVFPVVLAGGAAALVVGLSTANRVKSRQRREERIRRQRGEKVDGELARLEPGGHELLDVRAYELDPPVPPELTTSEAMAGLQGVADGSPPEHATVLTALWGNELLHVLDEERMLADTEVPLELRAAGEERVLEEAVQAAASDALGVDPDKDPEFEVKLHNVRDMVDAVRPYRVAKARRRAAEEVSDQLHTTVIGSVGISDLGERFLRAAVILDGDAPLDKEIAKLEQSYREAREKTERMEELYEALPASPARPAVAAALADVGAESAQTTEAYERVRRELQKARQLRQDQLDIPALAALLLLNHDEDAVDDFVKAYSANRAMGRKPGPSIEYSLAGLTTEKEINRLRRYAADTGLPVAIAAALMKRRDDGIEVYNQVLDELGSHGLEGESRRTIAGVLAVSMEPAQAVRRWVDARQALGDLGLEGSYADVAAAFGASDPRGPREFALAYAAQRQALARSSIDDADRYAPELAHAGTSRQEDSWTQDRIPSGLGTFDPFTFFFLHWIVLGGSRHTYGWEPVYNDRSWSGDSGSWWGGFGGGTFAGGGGGGSSWGGGGWGGGGFGGFGGGGFGGGGGGGSGW